LTASALWVLTKPRAAKGRFTLSPSSPTYQATLFLMIGPSLFAIVKGKQRQTLESLS